jgi:hypothetical protein
MIPGRMKRTRPRTVKTPMIKPTGKREEMLEMAELNPLFKLACLSSNISDEYWMTIAPDRVLMTHPIMTNRTATGIAATK